MILASVTHASVGRRDRIQPDRAKREQAAANTDENAGNPCDFWCKNSAMAPSFLGPDVEQYCRASRSKPLASHGGFDTIRSDPPSEGYRPILRVGPVSACSDWFWHVGRNWWTRSSLYRLGRYRAGASRLLVGQAA